MDLTTIGASVASALVSKVVLYPIDTLRTLQQTSTNTNYALPLSRYWRGLGGAMLMTTPAFVVYMVSYRELKKDLGPYLGEGTLRNYLVSGGIAEILSSVLWTPMEVIKGRLQIHEGAVKTNTYQMIRTVYREEGFKGYFRGYWIGLGVFLPYSMVYWASYEPVKTHLYRNYNNNSEELSPMHCGVASAVATTTATTCVNFLDVVKTRQQLAMSGEVAKVRPDDKLGIMKVTSNLLKETGFLRAAVKGLPMRLLHSIPAGALTMYIFESLDPDKPGSAIVEANADIQIT